MTILQRLSVNDAAVTVAIKPSTTLLEVLRDQLRLTGAKEACGRGECGACTVFADGHTVNACITLAGLVRREVVTIEGLTVATSELRAAFADHGAFQCGFCTPGMVVRAHWVLEHFNGPWTRQAISHQLAGNICRCTGYQGIVDAILAVRTARQRIPS